ncbi:MAG: hypothetical protein IKD18_03805 [Clostridia bacterium]|nr:hypothetical protein [Clostridia bacterium]
MREEKMRFESFELSASGFVRPSAVMRRMQQAARDDLNSFGISYEAMREKSMAFVVSRMALVFNRPVPGEVPLVLRTAANPTRGATFPRSFVLEDEAGEPVMRAMSLWALLDFEKRTLLRPSALWEEIPSFADLSDGVSCARLMKPSGILPCYSEERKVYASMLDQNNHLNNCNYADLATDLLPADAGEVKELQIAFQHEARLGEVLSLNGYDTSEGLLVSGGFRDREDNCFLCQIKLF